MNRREKFDAAREIRNRTNTPKKTKQTDSKRYIHTLPTGMCG